MTPRLSSVVTLASVRGELRQQPSLLRSFRASSAWRALPAGGDPIFVGAGDSYAASLCASFLAGPRVLALDPLSLAESTGWADERQVYIISVSGETRANIDLARALMGVAKETVAVTCNPKSRLAAVADGVIQLPFRPRGKSPGVATFVLSLAAALKICGLDSDCDFEGLFSRATAISKRIRVARGRNVTYFVGNNEAYGALVYGAAKIYELLGSRAQPSLLEEFSHMPLFSLSASDSVNVVESPAGEVGLQLLEKLGDAGYTSSLITLEGGRIERLYTLVFALQIAAVDAAKREGLKVPYFLTAKKKLRISDEMIY